MKRVIHLFSDKYKETYIEELSYSAWYIDEEWNICYQQMWAEQTFSIGMPIYDMEWTELWRISIWLCKNLNYWIDDFDLKIPVYKWQVEWYRWKPKKIQTYYQYKSLIS